MLAAKHGKFIDEYLLDMDASKAAIRAGYSSNGSAVQGYRLLQRKDVQEEISKRTQKLSADAGFDATIILQRINNIALESKADGDFKSALRANELLGKHLRLFIDRVEQTHSGNLTLLTEFPE